MVHDLAKLKKNPQDYPKLMELLKLLLKVSVTNESSLVLFDVS